MDKREKVIKGLERCIEKLDTVIDKAHGFNCTVCPYYQDCEDAGYLVGLPLMRDALERLKLDEKWMADYRRWHENQKNTIKKLLKEQEARHSLEVHNVGNVDIPEGVTEEQFYAVMNNVVAALEHTDRGESWPYEEDEGE